MKWRAALLVLAMAAAWLPVPRPVVEQLYASRVFPALQFVLTTLSNQVAFALFDLLVIVVLAWWLGQTIRDLAIGRRRGWLRALARIVLRTATLAAAAYLVFLVGWGFNYRRVPLADKLR